MQTPTEHPVSGGRERERECEWVRERERERERESERERETASTGDHAKCNQAIPALSMVG